MSFIPILPNSYFQICNYRRHRQEREGETLNCPRTVSFQKNNDENKPRKKEMR